MTNLFDPPPIYNLPLSYGNDVRLDFQNVLPGSSPASYQNYAAGTTAQLVIGKPGAILATANAVISTYHAVVRLESSVADGIKAGSLWRFIVSNSGDDVVACNGKTVRFDGT